MFLTRPSTSRVTFVKFLPNLCQGTCCEQDGVFNPNAVTSDDFRKHGLRVKTLE